MAKSPKAPWLTWDRYKESYGNIRCCDPGSCIPGRGQGVKLEEPAAVILHGGVCEGGDPSRSW
jgi:hypothetical protein